MRVFILQLLAGSDGKPQPRFSQWLAVLAAVLRNDRHELALAAFSRHQPASLLDRVGPFKPDAIYIEADRFAADVTRHAVECLGRDRSLPVIVGGPYPTAEPELAVSIPGVAAIAIGEPEASVPRFLRAMQDDQPFERTAGLWVHTDDGLVKNDLAPLAVALDLLPMAERDLFDYRQFVQRTRSAQISVARGCPNRCTYCLNDWLAEIMLGKGPWVRRRSPRNVCQEIDALCERYDRIERLTFVDHAFALDTDWLGQFVRLYAERCGLPFACHLRANAVTGEVARLLGDGGCDHATIEVISGSDFIRNEVFEMDTSNRQIETAFRLLGGAGIRTTAVNLLGSPYETPVTVENTLAMIEQIQPDCVQTRLFAPLPGTRAEELCRDCGWLSGLGEKAFCENTPMIDMPALPPMEIVSALHQFNWQARHPRAAGLMRMLARVRIGPKRSLYDLFVRQPVANGRLLPADPRDVGVAEHDGVMTP